MEKPFLQTTTPEIDSKLAFDISRHEEQINNIIIITICILIFLFRGYIGYWLKFGIAIPSGFSSEVINVENEPVQENYPDSVKKQKTFVYKSLINKHKMTIIPQAHYELSGLTVAKNHDFFFVNDFFDSAALIDLGVSWGEIGDVHVYKKYLKSYSAKTELTGSRILWTKAKRRDIPYSYTYLVEHFSHSHLVPANRNVMAALLKLRTWENVKITGELIDMESDDGYKHYRTSMTRGDTGVGDRGNGSCETIYVTEVQIGNKIYH